jgi:hypothetical protein
LTLIGWNEPGLAGDPGSFNWSLPEEWTFNVGEGSYIYVLAWDDGGQQMWTGHFSLPDGSMLYSDTTSWLFTVATGPNPTSSGGLPGHATVTTDILGATWAAPAAAVPNGSGPWGVIPNLSFAAQFVWHDTLDANSSSDDHYVIFRSLAPIVPISPNSAPENLTLVLDSATVDENGTVTLDGSFTDADTSDTHTVVIDWGSGEASTTLELSGESTFRISHQYLDDNASNEPNTPHDTYTIRVTVTDSEQESVSASTDVVVNNVVPVIDTLSNSSSVCGQTREGGATTIEGTFGDVGILDHHTVRIQWGDGTTTEHDVDSPSFSGHHVYSAGGLYTITTTILDDDGGVSSSSVTTALITGVGVQDGVLYVVGTEQDDHVTISRQGNGWLKVHADFLVQGNFVVVSNSAAISQVTVALCGPSDQLKIAGNMRVIEQNQTPTNYSAMDFVLANWTRQNSSNTSQAGGSGIDAIRLIYGGKKFKPTKTRLR